MRRTYEGLKYQKALEVTKGLFPFNSFFAIFCTKDLSRGVSPQAAAADRLAHKTAIFYTCVCAQFLHKQTGLGYGYNRTGQNRKLGLRRIIKLVDMITMNNIVFENCQLFE